MARLTEIQRRELWLADRKKTMSVQALCLQYGCSRTTLANIRREYETASSLQSEDEAPQSPTSSEASESSENSNTGSVAASQVEATVESNSFERNFPSYLELDSAEATPPREAVRPALPHVFHAPPVEVLHEPPQPVASEYQITKEKLYLCDKIKAFVHSFQHKLGPICGNTESERERWVDGLKYLEEDRLNSLLESIKYKISAGGLSDMTFTMFASVTLAL